MQFSLQLKTMEPKPQNLFDPKNFARKQKPSPQFEEINQSKMKQRISALTESQKASILALKEHRESKIKKVQKQPSQVIPEEEPTTESKQQLRSEVRKIVSKILSDKEIL